MMTRNSFDTRARLEVDGSTYEIYRLDRINTTTASAPRYSRSIGDLHSEVAAAGAVRPLADDRPHRGLVPRGARRPHRAVGRCRPTSAAGLGQGRVRRDEPSRFDLGAGRVIRVEELYPCPGAQLGVQIARYERANEVVWMQEEPENMGPWPFVGGRIPRLLEPGRILRVAGRAASGSPATGSRTVHEQEQEDLIDDAFAGL